MPLTLADLPPELFPNILNYVGTNARGRNTKPEQRRRELKNCSLVCVDWAKRCRDYLFYGKSITIKSGADYAVLEHYATHGSDRLDSIAGLLHSTAAEQNWDGPSWVHRSYHSPFFPDNDDDETEDVNGPRGYDLTLRGPVPSHLPRAAYRSPHWSIPRSLPNCYLKFSRLMLYDVRFPRLSDLHALIRHFTLTRIFLFERLTWDKTDVSIPRLGASKTRGSCTRVSAKGCTDDAVVCLLTFHRLHPSFEWPFSYMGSGEVDAYLTLIRAISKFDVDPKQKADGKRRPVGRVDGDDDDLPEFIISRGLQENKHLINEVPRVKIDLARSLIMEASGTSGVSNVTLNIQCTTDLAPNPPPGGPAAPTASVVSSMRVAGLRLELDCHESDDDMQQQQHVAHILRTLHSVLPSFVRLRAVELHTDLPVLKNAVKVSPDISNIPAVDGLLYRWGCSAFELEQEGDCPPEAEGYECVGIDPVTLELSGQYWDFSAAEAFTNTDGVESPVRNDSDSDDDDDDGDGFSRTYDYDRTELSSRSGSRSSSWVDESSSGSNSGSGSRSGSDEDEDGDGSEMDSDCSHPEEGE